MISSPYCTLSKVFAYVFCIDSYKMLQIVTFCNYLNEDKVSCQLPTWMKIFMPRSVWHHFIAVKNN